MDNELADTQRRRPARRRHPLESWQRTGLVLLSAFLLWVVMDATVLQHNATVISPQGTRRTVALDVLGPIAVLSRATGLDLPVAGANLALGRTSDGGFVVPTVPTTTTIPGTSTTTTTIPYQPTKKHPLHVLLIGDSIGTDLDYSLLEDLTGTGVTVVWTDDVIDTGLVNSAYFNWPATLASDMYRYKPQVVIGMMGANDDTNFASGLAYPSKAWQAQYLKVVGQFFTIGTEYGAKMIWVSVPLMSTPGWQSIRGIQYLAAKKHHVFYVDSDRTLNPGGTFHMFLRVDGTIEQIRQSDGVHLAPAGADLLALAVMKALQRDLHVHL